MTVRIGATIARKYRVERVLGAGGMGVVVAARDRELDRRVAIKLLRKDVLAAGAVERFLREARAAASLDSVHVARVLEVGRARGGAPFIVLEHLEGEDLHARVAYGPEAEVADAVRWILEACEGLAAAHARGIVHRDLKPSNLFLARQRDGSEVVKLLDFGLAKNPDDDDGRITATGAILGSPAYMSPEHLSGHALDARSDVWSLAVTLYELLTRALPFPGKTTPETCAAVLSSEPIRIDAHRADVPVGLERVIERCLSKAPADRPANVAELAALLEPFAEGAGGAAERIARTLAHVESPAAAVTGARGASTQLVTAVEARPRERTSLLLAIALFVLVIGSATAFVRMHRATPPVVAAPPPPTASAPPAPSIEPVVVPTVTAIVSATPAPTPRPRAVARPRPTSRPQPAASHDPLERF